MVKTVPIYSIVTLYLGLGLRPRINIVFIKLSGIDSCEKHNNILVGHAFLWFVNSKTDMIYYSMSVIHRFKSVLFKWILTFWAIILPINSLFIFLFLGQCFVPISDIQHLLTFQFKSLLTQNIALTAKILPNLDEDDRLIRYHPYIT